jgi:hypothetical protein
MPQKRKVKADDILRDLRAGMSDSELMTKYFLSSRGLQSILEKLLEANVLTKEQLLSFRRGIGGDDTVDVEPARLFPRDLVEFPVPVYDSRNRHIKGTITDITEKGVGVRGIEVEVGETRMFVIPAADFTLVDSFAFEAQCRWVKREDVEGNLLAGFQITGISPDGLMQLRNLIRALTLYD